MKVAAEASRPSDRAFQEEPDASEFRLSDSPSHLLRRAQQYVSDIFLKTSLADSVTLRQSVVLAAIAEQEGQSQTALVQATGVDRSTLAEMISRMEKRGLVRRVADKDDGRAKSVSLTDAGREALAEALPVMRTVDQALMDILPRNRRKSFRDTLEIIVERAVEAETAEMERLKAARKAEKAKKKKNKKKKRRKK
jgi:DNA-binding MarR family transcriptional regulator